MAPWCIVSLVPSLTKALVALGVGSGGRRPHPLLHRAASGGRRDTEGRRAIMMALAFYLSALSLEASEPNAMIYLAYVAGVVLAIGLLVLGVGLIRGRRTLPAR